jgi:hypothetical protein
MLASLFAFLFHVLFGPLVALLIVFLREAITGRWVSKWYSLFGLLPIVGWFFAALWPAPRFRYDPRQGYVENR